MYSKKETRWQQAILMMIAVFAFVLLTASSVSAAVFTDVEGHWAEAQITDWQEQGLISGYPDGSFRPNTAVTRAEFMTLVNRAFGYTEEAAVSFPDVKTTDWFCAEVAKAVAAGYMEGYQDGSMRPNIPISREEAAVILCRTLNIDVSEIDHEKDFADDEAVGDWSRSSVDAVVNLGYMVGYPNHTFRPQNNMTRAEAVTVLVRTRNLLLSEAGIYGPETGSQTILGSVTISATGVTLRNTVIEGDLYLAPGITEGQINLNNVTVKGRTLITAEGSAETAGVLSEAALFSEAAVVPSAAHRIVVVASGSTVLGSVECAANAILEERELTGDGFGDVTVTATAAVDLYGSFGQVTVTGDDVQLGIDGTAATLTVAEGALNGEIELSEETVIQTLTLNAAATVTGEGFIVTAHLNSSGSVLSARPDTVNLGDGVTGTVGGVALGHTVVEDGTVEHPYRIDTAAELNAVRGGVPGYDGWDLSKSYQLMANIDLSAYATGDGFAPLGDWSEPFTGSFDGNGFVIKNLYINRDSDYAVGLFGAVEGGEVKNVTLLNVDITGADSVGGLFGSAEDGATICACSVTGDIKAEEGYAGGIGGYLDEGTLENCYAAGNVSADSYCVGGLLGENGGAVAYSYANCKVSGSSYTGGLVGYNYGVIAATNYVLGGSVTSIDGGYTYWEETSFGRIAGGNDDECTCDGISVSDLQFFANPIDGEGQSFSGMTGVNGTDASAPVAFTAWDFENIWKTGGNGRTVFQWQNAAAVPSVPWLQGVAAGGTYYEVSPHWITESGVSYTATLSKDGAAATTFASGTTVAASGSYLLKVTATKTATGLKSTASLAFTIDRDPLVAPTLSGVTDGGVYNAVLPNPSFHSYYFCEEELSSDGGATFEPYDKDLFATVGVTDFVYQVTAKALTYPDASSTASFTVNGAGTEEKPFLIYTAADLAAMDDGSSYDWGHLGEYGDDMTPLYYELQNNIDLTGIAWEPLGSRDFGGSFAFCGVFEGNGYTVSNLTIDKPSESYLGMFSLNEGEIHDLQLTNVSVLGNVLTGGLVGQNHGPISGCSVSGSVSGEGYIGGLVGNNYDSDGVITECTSSAVVTATGNQGGGSLVGRNNGTIENCGASGNVGGGSYLGGLVGRTGTSSEITASFAAGAVSGSVALGGFLGENYGTVTDCYATGAVSGSGSAVGGLAGINTNMIQRCYALGNATGTWAIGGLVGTNFSSITGVTAAVSDCVAIGSASGTEGMVGPVFGNNTATVLNCLSGLTTPAAQAKATYTALSWDFDTVWTIIEGSGYPTLLWQS